MLQIQTKYSKAQTRYVNNRKEPTFVRIHMATWKLVCFFYNGILVVKHKDFVPTYGTHIGFKLPHRHTCCSVILSTNREKTLKSNIDSQHAKVPCTHPLIYVGGHPQTKDSTVIIVLIGCFLFFSTDQPSH